MTDSVSCPRCGTQLSAGEPSGRPCARCLLAAAQLDSAPLAGATLTASAEARVPPPPDAIAALFPQLEILSVLGQGGMGVVYRARQKELGRDVALKLLWGQAGADAALAERFLREARAMARLSHPNIVGVHDFGRAGGHLYLVLELIEGVNLRQALKAGRMESAQALSIVGETCAALQYAHDRGVVHRDIKPENILLDRAGHVKIADFGLAMLSLSGAPGERLTRESQAMGTPQYMAPEQLERPLAVDHRADIFSLGVVFYELLTGELPLGRFAPPSRKVLIDVRLDGVVLKALEKELEQRYQRASDVRTDVESIACPAVAASPAQARSRPSTSTLVLVTMAILVALPISILALMNLFGSAYAEPLSKQHAPSQENTVRQELDDAIESYRSAVASEASTLLTAFESALASLPALAKMDKEAKLALDATLRSQCTAFIEHGTLPDHALLNKARETFAKASDKARRKCANAFDKAEKAYASTDMALLRTVRAERTEVLDGRVELDKAVVDGFRLRVITLPTWPPQDEDSVYQGIARATQQFQQATADEAKRLLDAIDAALAGIPAMENLTSEQKLALDEELRTQRMAFADKGELPSHASLRLLRDAFEKGVGMARKKCEQEFANAEQRYANQSIPMLRRLRNEKVALLAKPIEGVGQPTPVNLLANFDPATNALRGAWERVENGHLRTSVTSEIPTAPTIAFATESIPLSVGAPFRVDLAFEIGALGRESAVFLLVPVGAEQYLWTLGGWNNSTAQIAFEPGHVEYFAARRPFFVEGYQYHFAVTVTQNEMSIAQDGQVLYTALRSEATARKYADYPKDALCLRACSAVTIHELSWTTLPAGSVEGNIPRSEAPATTPVRSDIVEWLPVGTTMQCRRTRSNGSPESVTGTVVENDGHQLVVEAPGLSGPTRLWKFAVEASGMLRLSEQIKKDPAQVGGLIRNCTGQLRVDERGISGNYSWELDGESGEPEKVTGTLAWDVIKRRADPDDQLAFWPVGTRVTGTRGADVDVSLEGVVRLSDDRRLEIEITESWHKNGGTFRPKVLWIYERVRVDAKSGKVTLRNIAQNHIGGGVTRSAVQGDVVIDAKKLRGDYQFDYQVPGEELKKGDRRWAVELKVEG